MKAYEIQTRRNGEWKIDSVFDDRELALYEARRVEASKRHGAVRVVEEIYDESTEETTSRVIFRGSQADTETRARRAAAAGQPPGPAGRRPGTGRAAARKPKPAPKPARRSKQERPLVSALLLLLVFALGFAGLVALAQLS